MSNYQNNNNGAPKQYAKANVGKLYARNGQYGQYFQGDFMGAQVSGRIDPQGNISIQFDTEHAETLKALIRTYLDESGLSQKYADEKAAYLAKKNATAPANNYQPAAQAPAPQAAAPGYAPKAPYKPNAYRR